jgi:hypothetical protein
MISNAVAVVAIQIGTWCPERAGAEGDVLKVR